MKRIFTFCCLFLLALASTAQTALPKLDVKKLPGNWISMDDWKYQVVFTDSTQTDHYEDEKQAQLKYSVTGDQMTATDQESGEIYKYTILSVSDRNLILQQIPRGTLLLFSRDDLEEDEKTALQPVSPDADMK